MARDWFTPPPLGGFYLVDTRTQPGVIHDATRPFVVRERYYAGYKTGMTTCYHGSYETLEQAKRRIRALESR